MPIESFPNSPNMHQTKIPRGWITFFVLFSLLIILSFVINSWKNAFWCKFHWFKNQNWLNCNTCTPTDDEKVTGAATYIKDDNGDCVANTCVSGYNITPVGNKCNLDTLSFNTLYKVTGISQTGTRGKTVAWGDNMSANVFLNKTDSPYDTVSKDEIADGDSIVMQIPIIEQNDNQGCTDCGQYGCRVLIINDDKNSTSWGHGSEIKDDGTCDKINPLSKIELKQGNDDGTFVITDGSKVDHNVTFTPFK